MRELITSAYTSQKGTILKCGGLDRLWYKKLLVRRLFLKKLMRAIKWKEGPKELRYIGIVWLYAVPNTELRFIAFVKIFWIIELFDSIFEKIRDCTAGILDGLVSIRG